MYKFGSDRYTVSLAYFKASTYVIRIPIRNSLQLNATEI